MTQLSDQQLLRLEQLLDDPVLEESMRLDEAQGYLCAALSGPRPSTEAEWLRKVLASDGDDDVSREAAGLLRLLAAQLQAELTRGEAPMLLLYAQDSNDANSHSDYVPWCLAYLHGVDSASVNWFDALGDDDDEEDSDQITYLDEQLFPLFMLSGDAEAAASAAGEDFLSGRDPSRFREECEEQLPQAVINIYRFWMAQRSVNTVRRERPKVGRNDPCPCGSGAKYKKCCGAASAR